MGRRKDEKVIKTKLYTFAGMKKAVMRAVSDVAMSSVDDSDFDNSARVALIEMAVGSRIVNNLDKKHEKGEL